MMEIQVEYVIGISYKRGMHYELEQKHNERCNESDVSLNGIIVELCGKHTHTHTHTHTSYCK